MAYRKDVNDFRAEVAARTNAAGTRVWTTTVDAGGFVVIRLNGTVVYPKVAWSISQPSAALTDAGGNNVDAVTFQGPDGNWASGSAEQFIRSLT